MRKRHYDERSPLNDGGGFSVFPFSPGLLHEGITPQMLCYDFSG
jgi:hypothetical protein